MLKHGTISLLTVPVLLGLSGCAAQNDLPDAPSAYPAQPAMPGGYNGGYAQAEYSNPYGASYDAAAGGQPGNAQPGAGNPAYVPPGYSQPGATVNTQARDIADNYLIGALDELTIFVWRNPELGAKVQVRPDGRITTPLITDMPAAGKTPTKLAADIRDQLSQYINDPLVNVIVSGFAGNYQQQIQIIGATEKPASLNFRANMTLLDALIAVGGLSEFAAGNRAKLSRLDLNTGRRKEYRLRIDDLLEDGDMRANVLLQPGDVITIPTSMF